MIVSNYILYGNFDKIKIGHRINNSEFITKDQEGEIPGIIELDYFDFFFQVYFFNQIIIGISIDFKYFPKKKFTIKNKISSFSICYNSKFLKIKEELIKLDIIFEIRDLDNENSWIIITKSKVRLMFYNGRLFKASVFDDNLYESLLIKQI